MGHEFDRVFQSTTKQRALAYVGVAVVVLTVPLLALGLALSNPAGSMLRYLGIALFVGYMAVTYGDRLTYRRKERWVPWFPHKGYSGPSWMDAQMLVSMHGFDTVLQFFFAMARAFDFQTFWMRLPPFNVVVVLSPAHIEHVLDKAFLKYEKGAKFHSILSDSLGDGIFNSDGDRWKQQRRTAAHLFTSWQLENRMNVVFQRHAQQLCDVLRSAKGGRVDIQKLMYCFTFDSIYEIAFGKAVNSLGGNEKDVAFQAAFDFVQENAASRFVTPSLVWKLKRFFGYGWEGRATEAIHTLKGYAKQVIGDRRRAGDIGVETDLISLLEEQNEANRESGEGKVYSDEEIIDFITNFTIAGRDTTASLLTFTFYELSRPSAARHREAMEQEFARVDDLREMHYTQAVLQEALRMWPGVPTDIKMCVEKDVLPCGSTVYPGDAVMYSPLIFGRNPTNFSDPNEFKPERWLSTDGTCIKYDPKGYLYPMFNAGPRTCLGRNMAFLEAKVVLSTLMSEFRITVPQDHVVEPKLTIVMMSGNGMPADVTPREA